MWDFISPVNVIRYLVVWQVNCSLVQLPRYLPTKLSQTLGTLIANRLPTQQARDWRKAVAAWEQTAAAVAADEHRRPISDVSWPFESVLFVYPVKRAYGEGETILWELKLLGDSADHGLFLEYLLPAMEEAATTTDPRWQHLNSLWGHFDIRAIYAARGSRWEPFVSEGRLNLDYRATSTQWAEGLTREASSDLTDRFQHLTWITPFDLATTPNPADSPRRSSKVPSLHTILDALMERMTQFLPGKRRVAADAWALLSSEEQTALCLALEQSLPQRSSLAAPPRDWPGRWMGTQIFKTIPACVLPYLELASILHVGRQTHLGCGTFRLG